MVLSLNCEITIYNRISTTNKEYNIDKPIIINKVVGLSIESKIENLTDLCTIILPKPDAIIAISSEQQTELYYDYNFDKLNNNKFFVGSRVIVKYGYDITDFTNEPVKFYGYIESILEDDKHITVKCEDSMYLFKNSKRIIFSELNNRLDTIIKDSIRKSGISTTMLPDNQINIIDFTFQKIKAIEALTVSEIIQMIKEQYKFYAFFRLKNDLPVLYIGLKYPLDTNYSKTFNFNFPYNKERNIVISKKISNIKNDYYNTYVIVSSTQGDNKVKTVVCDSSNPNGLSVNDTNKKVDPIKSILEKDNKIEINIGGLSEDSCKSIAKNRFSQVKLNTIEGSFETFGEPFMKQGDIINLKMESNVSSPVEYTFYIDSIETKYANGNGIRQNITIGDFAKIS